MKLVKITLEEGIVFLVHQDLIRRLVLLLILGKILTSISSKF